MYATSGIKPSKQPKGAGKQPAPMLLLSTLIAVGVLIRLFRLLWQPLWWDEGYSVYFATEPLGRMLWLTAHDIHPPLYYMLLHGWLLLFQSAQPVVLRLFSVFIGGLALPLFAWLAHSFFPARRHLPWLATLLLLVNPMHLFYSQEVRMYGLAMVVSMVSTVFFWKFIQQNDRQSDVRPPDLARTSIWDRIRQRLAGQPLIGYIIAASLALYTLYYLALLLLAHFVWACWYFRHKFRQIVPLLWADVMISLLYLPWIVYAGPKLILYIHSKVRSDNDTPLTILTYLARHLLAFTCGHLAPENSLLHLLSLAAIIAMIPLLISTRRISRESYRPLSALFTFLIFPFALGYLLNRQFPFFPEGGERLLLFVLPYFLLIIAVLIDRDRRAWRSRLALVALLVSATIGYWTFYTTPRYRADDYRPLIRQVVQQGTDSDTVLAIFPWQVGYWRAYAPTEGLRLRNGPYPELVAEGALTWGPTVQRAIDTALARGTLWFPAPLSFGSTLPPQIDHYLAQRATNLANIWYNTTTRLYAWRSLATDPLQPHTDDFGPLQLVGASVTPQQVSSANQPLAFALAWHIVNHTPKNTQLYGVTVRLQDQQGRTWANRDYAPVGSLSLITGTAQPIDAFGFVTPVGLPPGVYTLTVGVVDSAQQLLARAHVTSVNNAHDLAHFAPIAAITVTQPAQAMPPFRLPMQAALAQPLTHDGLTLLGYAGYTTGDELQAGEAMDLDLFLQNHLAKPPNHQLYISLLDGKGNGVAGWSGWPLPDYPTSAWPAGGLGQAPVTFYLPPELSSGRYQLIAGFLDPATGIKSSAATLDQVRIHQRAASFTKPAMTHVLAEPVQFGTHVRLLGYDLVQNDRQLALRLHWQVIQTLVPSHHIFVHVDTSDNRTLAQDDGQPHTETEAAPTGSWRPDEYLTTLHQINLPTTMPAGVVLHIGLYVPATGQRLPASSSGTAMGDTAAIGLQP